MLIRRYQPHRRMSPDHAIQSYVTWVKVNARIIEYFSLSSSKRSLCSIALLLNGYTWLRHNCFFFLQSWAFRKVKKSTLLIHKHSHTFISNCYFLWIIAMQKNALRDDRLHTLRPCNKNYGYLIFNVYHGPTRPMNFSIVWVNWRVYFQNVLNPLLVLLRKQVSLTEFIHVSMGKQNLD